MIQVVKEYGVLIAAWGMTLFRATTLLAHPKNRRSNVRLWLLALSLSLMLTFEFDVVYATVDNLAGLNNLSWLLAYLCGLITAYLVFCVCSGKASRVMLLYLFVTGMLIIAVFPFGPGQAPETLYHVVAYNGHEIMFAGLYYGYAIAGMGPVPIRSSLKVCRESQDIFTRSRAIVTLLMLYAAVLFSVTKLTVFAAGYFASPTQLPLAAAITNLIEVLAIAMAILWALMFASNGLYRALTRPLEFVRKVLVLRKLTVLKNNLSHFAPATIPLPRSPWWDQVRNPDFYIYRAVIDILDSKRVLTAQLEQVGAIEEAGLAHALEEYPAYLRRVLQETPATASFEDLVETCAAIAN
jgi:hypothetical protein